jgi:hypothetical protein
MNLSGSEAIHSAASAGKTGNREWPQFLKSRREPALTTSQEQRKHPWDRQNAVLSRARSFVRKEKLTMASLTTSQEQRGPSIQ